jgi:TatA/E family protein of Tat protein translocase
MGLGFPEILVIVLVILLLFGPKRIPELSRAVGRGLREFRKAMREIESQLDEHTRPVRDAADEFRREINPLAPDHPPPRKKLPDSDKDSPA